MARQPEETTMTASSVVFSNVAPSCAFFLSPSSWSALPQAAGHVVARWRQQTAAAAQRNRLRRTERDLQAKQRQMVRLPLASRDRSALRFEVLSLHCKLQAMTALAAGQAKTASRCYAEATWFAAEARRLGCWGPVA
jgi:hypothetical protein